MKSLGFLCFFFSFAWAPLYFSDDALRHIHEGYYLLAGVDVYKTAPQELKAILAQSPNHPELGSLYLPLTQLQAMLGALFSVPQGFRFVYIFFCVLFMALTWLFGKGEGRSFYLNFYFSPPFLIFLASHHADLQGFLLLGLIGVGLQASFTKEATNSFLGRYSFLYFGLGFLSALLPGLKAEGLVWLLYLSFYFLSKSYFHFSYGAMFKKVSLLWLSGLILGLGLEGLFAWLFLFRSADSFFAFLETASFFTDWFLAYNPILDLRTFMYEEGLTLRPEIFAHYRRQIYLIALLSFFLLPGFLILYGKKECGLKGKKAPLQIYIENLLESFLKVSLFAFLAFKGVWHPWYFLWLLPALWAYPDYKGHEKKNSIAFSCARFLTALLPLFYIPIVQLRAKGIWQMQGFYIAFVLIGIFHFVFTKRRQIRSLVLGLAKTSS